MRQLLALGDIPPVAGCIETVSEPAVPFLLVETMAATVTIASVRAHGVCQLLVYCLGKREGDWPCHHQGTLPVDRFKADEVLQEIERRCRSTVSGSRRAGLLQQAAGGTAERRWMTPPERKPG